MRAKEYSIRIKVGDLSAGVMEAFSPARQVVREADQLIRFVISKWDGEDLECQLSILEDHPLGTENGTGSRDDLFTFRKRAFADASTFNAVMVIPTGIGAEIGGHAGDAGPAVRLLASCCDTLVVNPNAVNASDLNELPGNALYVEGSVITRLMMGTAGLVRSRANRMLVVMEEHEDPRITDWAVNAVNASYASTGFNPCKIVLMKPCFKMNATFEDNGRAVGCVENLERLFEVLDAEVHDFNAIALTSVIDYSLGETLRYWTGNGGVNPWGGVEAMLTHAVSSRYNLPSAHAPELIRADWLERAAAEVGDFDRVAQGLGVVEPSMAAEVVSLTFLHCVLKGLHASPAILTDRNCFNSAGVFSSENISCLVQPERCIGLPTLAALENGITVIAVKDRSHVMAAPLDKLPWRPGQLLTVNTYLEAAGLLSALRAGVEPSTLTRPVRRRDVVRA